MRGGFANRDPIVIAVGLLLASPAWGDGWPDCNQSADRYRQIKGYSQVIAEGRSDTMNTAIAYNHRGNAYRALKQYRRAIQPGFPRWFLPSTEDGSTIAY